MSMNHSYKILQSILVSMFVLAAGASVFSQGRPPAEGAVVFQREVQGPVMTQAPPSGEDAFYFVSSEMSFDGKLVKGAPYSAQAVTETTQTLSDGNRIVNKSSASVYRDSEGRTRREQTLRAIGPFANANEGPQSIFINDPVSGMSYVLEPGSHNARKMPTRRFEYRTSAPPDGDKAPTAPDGPGVPRATRRPGDNSDFVVSVAPPAEGRGGFTMEFHNCGERRERTESVGKQSLEGVEAEGTRTILTIPAGEIGNERPIEVVNERWYSPE